MSIIKELRQLYENIICYAKRLYGKAKAHPLAHLIIIFIFIIALLSLIFIPPYQVSRINDTNITEKVKQENQDRATLAQIFGGVAIGIGLYYTWRQISIAEKDLKVTQRTLGVAQKNLNATQKIAEDDRKVAQEGQITERFTRAVNQLGAIDQLGNPAVEIRLGGIYALERIANESEKDYGSIMEILTAYVRKNSNVESRTFRAISMDTLAVEGENTDCSKVKKIALDIQVILTVIGRRKNNLNDGKFNCLNLQMTCLQGADLRGAHLEGAKLMDTHLERAKLWGAHLEGADFVNDELLLNTVIRSEAHLEGADL
jgi:hypothetical protein